MAAKMSFAVTLSAACKTRPNSASTGTPQTCAMYAMRAVVATFSS
jgi:hypothetical protein